MADVELRDKIYQLLQNLETPSLTERALMFDYHRDSMPRPEEPNPNERRRRRHRRNHKPDDPRCALCGLFDDDDHLNWCRSVLVQCKHCKKDLQRGSITRHEAICRHNPKKHSK